MSTSGSTSWSLNRDEVINAALRKLAVLSGGSTPETFEVTNATQALNAMVKAFHADGMPVWAINSYSFTTTGAVQYTIGTGQTLNTPAPLKIVQAYYVQGTGSNVPMNVYTKYDFNLLPVNNTSGQPVNLYYQPFPETGIISLWPAATSPVVTVTIFYQRPFEDMNAATDDFDFPPYWTEALIYGLAWRLAPEYGVPINDRNQMAQEAKYFHEQALSFGTEEGSWFMQPDRTGKR